MNDADATPAHKDRRGEGHPGGLIIKDLTGFTHHPSCPPWELGLRLEANLSGLFLHF